MTPEEVGPHTRALMERVSREVRILITDPASVERVRAAVDEMGRGALIEVRSSPACPPGKILVLHQPTP